MTPGTGHAHTSDPLPHFVVAGAPKAGTTALHGALATHPDLYLSPVKEPKFYLTDGRPPPRSRHRGPGDAHSSQEWVWRRDRYLRLFAGAPPSALRGESTPFYLHDRAAQRRLVADVPQVKVVVVVRDPVDRALSNWVHLRADGLEPEADFLRAVGLEDERAAAGWAPFWRYRDLGRYGEQLRDLRTLLPAEQVLVLRYRDVVSHPATTLDRVAGFLGVATGLAHAVPPDNVKPYVPDTARYRGRCPARPGSAPARARCCRRGCGGRRAARCSPRCTPSAPRRPTLPVEVRRAVLEPLLPDIALLEELTGESFDDWRSDVGRGDFRSRTSTP